MSPTPELIQSVAFAIGFLESELPPGHKRLDPWQREIARSVVSLRQLHRRLSPPGDRLAAVGAESPRRSNFDNVGRPAPEL